MEVEGASGRNVDSPNILSTILLDLLLPPKPGLFSLFLQRFFLVLYHSSQRPVSSPSLHHIYIPEGSRVEGPLYPVSLLWFLFVQNLTTYVSIPQTRTRAHVHSSATVTGVQDGDLRCLFRRIQSPSSSL